MSYIGSKPANKPLTSSDIEDGIITTTKIADANVTNPKLTSGSQQNFRNIIINGDMSIAQRGTSETGITSQGYYTLDRFRTVGGGSFQGTWTQSQDTDVPSGQGFAKSLKMDCTTADASPASNDAIYIQQRVEGQNLQYLKKGTANAESLTMSFWVKSNKTGTYICELRDTDNSRQNSQSYTISSANTWEKKTLTFSGDTTGAFDNDNNSSFQIHFWLGAGSNYTSGTLNTSWNAETTANRAVGQVNLADSTSNEFYITGVQLEAGTTASDFEFLPHDVNLERCLRYFEKSFNQGTTPANSVIVNVFFGRRGNIYFKKTKRTNPTMVSYSPLNSNGTWQWYSGIWNSVTPNFGISNTLFSYDLGGYEYTDVYGAWTADAEL